MMQRGVWMVVGFIAIMTLGTVTMPSADAEVRFGKNVRIGGHDVSGQTYNRNPRGRFYIYNGRPRNPGCRWVRNRDGSSTQVCHLQRKR
jgi:hypothetical protein